MQILNRQAERRGFLLGMTLNELAFLLFFLLVLISAYLLEDGKRQIAEKTAHLEHLQRQLLQQQKMLDQTFQKLGILQSGFDRLQELQPRIRPAELGERFKRLVESESKVREENEDLRKEFQKLMELLQTRVPLNEAEPSESPREAVQALIEHDRQIKSKNQELQARIEQLHSRFTGSGLDHLPCWTDPRTGEIQYLYRITILENRLEIESVWPAARTAEIDRSDWLRAPVNRTVSFSEFQRLATPILTWSRQQKPECRHFVRIHDDESTSKSAFKKQLQLIESYFYKYLEPDAS